MSTARLRRTALVRSTALALVVAMTVGCVGSATESSGPSRPSLSEPSAPAAPSILAMVDAPSGTLRSRWGADGTSSQRAQGAQGANPAGASTAPAPDPFEGLTRLAHSADGQFALQTESGEFGFLTGVNLGPTLPGQWPGELGVDRATWDRWFPMIASLGVMSVRVYTVQPPSFYEALHAYNQAHPTQPLYLIHGVWLAEDLLETYGHLLAPEVVQRASTDARDAVAAVHGDIELAPRVGYASGRYTADVSPWVVAWVFGVELPPPLVLETDRRNEGVTFTGTFVSATADASPTEVFLAQQLDGLASAEAGRGRTMPLSFVNWSTVDPLRHPTEPYPEEDIAGIDANHVLPEAAWGGGMFASYQTYPYYPDFLRYEPGVANYLHVRPDGSGRIDPYAGYLARLRKHHERVGLPVMVLESGVPSSWGSVHFEPEIGRHSGGHDERAALALTAGLVDVHSDLGLAGSIVFSWQDEWFKGTYTLRELEVPIARRAYWTNALNNESSYGLLAMDPGAAGDRVVIDGLVDDWNDRNGPALFADAGGGGAVSAVRVRHDEGFLYLALEFRDPSVWQSERVVVGVDTVDGGTSGLPGAPEVGVDADVAFGFGGRRPADAQVRASNDYNELVLAPRLDLDPDLEPDPAPEWNPQRMLANPPLLLPGDGRSLAGGVVRSQPTAVRQLRPGRRRLRQSDLLVG